MERTITVSGSGTASVAPDIATVSGELRGMSREYADAVGASAAVTSELRKAVGEAGFDMDDLRTRSFSVSPVYRTDGDGRSVFEGYQYRHGVQMTVDADGESVGRLLDAMVGCCGAPEFRVSYGVRDPSGAQREARRAAVRDARRKAKELAEAAGVRLGDIVGIAYGDGHAEPRHARMVMSMSVDAVPEDAEFCDSVTVVWRIA